LEKYQPHDETNFSFLLQIMVGVRGEDGEESFDAIVCTPKWIFSNLKKKDLLFGYHHLIVQEYDYALMVAKIKKFIGNLGSRDWKDVAEKMSYSGFF